MAKSSYVDRGRPGELRYRGGKLLLVKEPLSVPRAVLTLQAMRRHNTLQPLLQPTHRTFLRWSESGGTGLPNPAAETRELHYDPLPPDLQEIVDGIVEGSPWRMFVVKWYRTTLTSHQLAQEMRISRSQLYTDWRASLWYFHGRFEGAGVQG